MKYNIWDIKSPWLRIPVAWILAPAAVLLFLSFVACEAIVDGCRGCIRSARRTSKHLEIGSIWTAMTALRKPT